MLQERVYEKESNLKEISLQLQETQRDCNLLKDSASMNAKISLSLICSKDHLCI